MKPFNLEEALNGAKVVTRDGREVTQLINFNADEKETLYGVVGKEIASWKDDGRFSFIPPYNDHILDLFMHVEPLRSYANIYLDTEFNFLFIGETCEFEKTAKEKGKSSTTIKYIKTIEINDIV